MAKKIIKIALVILLLVALLFGGIYFYTMRTIEKLDPVVNRMLIDLSEANWSDQAFKQHSTDEFKALLEKKPNIFSFVNKLGDYKNYKGIQNVTIQPSQTNIIALTEFTTGSATIKASLTETSQGVYKLTGFYVESEALLDLMQK